MTETRGERRATSRTFLFWTCLATDLAVIAWTFGRLAGPCTREWTFSDVASLFLVALAVAAFAVTLSAKRVFSRELRAVAAVIAVVTCLIALLPWIASLLTDCVS
jgi:hypothetical protein